MSRAYTKDGVTYPSVTTVISAIGSKALMRWANAMGFKHVNVEKFMNEKATYGTLAHNILRQEVDKTYEFKHEFKNALIESQMNNTLKNFRLAFKDIEYDTLDTEKEMCSERLGYGGTCDWLLSYDNKVCLYDFKTSKKYKPYMALQLAAYSLLLAEEDIHINEFAIVLIHEDSCKRVIVPNETIDHAKEAFLYLLAFYNKWHQYID